MTLVLVLAGAVTAALWIAAPVFQRSRFAPSSFESSAMLRQAKEHAFAALHDVELDYRTGKLSYDEYLRLRDDCESEAARIVQKIRIIDGPDSSEDAGLEAQIAQARRLLRSS